MKIIKDGKEIELDSTITFNGKDYVLKGVLTKIWLKGQEGSIDVLPCDLGIEIKFDK